MHEFLTGEAGTGKTTILREKCAVPGYGMLVSTTGISAVNSGTQTLNSLLKYYDTASLSRLARTDRLYNTLSDLEQNGVLGRHLCIDEVSMMEARQLDIIFAAMSKSIPDVSLVLTGDFAQLPPVEGEYAFKSRYWDVFEHNTTKLTVNHRQDHDFTFLQALRTIRRGDKMGAQMLKDAGANFVSALDVNFPGITVFPTNVEANAMNGRRFATLSSTTALFTTDRKYKQASEWADIPNVLMLKVGARVIITANAQGFEYANGDLGEVTNFEYTPGGRPYGAYVKLDRNGQEVLIPPIERKWMDYSERPPRFMGSITFLPIKLGYALTIHKTQGLTLPALQISTDMSNWRDPNIVPPALMYVAASRARTAESVRIVGSVDDLASKIASHPEVERFL